MTCPDCHAALLPVEGELFCLQCGQVYVTAQTQPTVPEPEVAAEAEVISPAPSIVPAPVPKTSWWRKLTGRQ